MMKNIVVDGFTLNYIIRGSGYPTLVIGSSVYYPRTFSTDLDTQLQLVFMDHRGFGSVDRNVQESDFDLEKLIEDLEVLRRHLSFKTWYVIGHSGHGYIALEYAKKYPRSVSHVILIALSPDSSPSSFIAADQYFQDSVCPKRKDLFTQKMQQLPLDIQRDSKRRFILYSLCSGPRIWFDYKYDASYLWFDVKVIPEMFDYVWGVVFKKLDIQENLTQLKQPVLLLLGRYDYWNPPYLWNSVRLKFHNITVKIFEKSGHTPQLEQAFDFSRELFEWLKINNNKKSNKL